METECEKCGKASTDVNQCRISYNSEVQCYIELCEDCFEELMVLVKGWKLGEV